MAAATAEEPQAEIAVPLAVVEASGDEVLTAFAQVMLEWGYYRTAAGLRFPTAEEAAGAAARWPVRSRNRRPDGTWNPIP